MPPKMQQSQTQPAFGLLVPVSEARLTGFQINFLYHFQPINHSHTETSVMATCFLPQQIQNPLSREASFESSPP